MLIKSYELEVSIINIYVKIYLSISILLKFNNIPYKINKIIIFIYLPKKCCQSIRGIVLIYVLTLI